MLTWKKPHVNSNRVVWRTFLFIALDSALALQEDVGVAVIEKEISRLSQILREKLVANPKVELVTPLNQKGGVTSFKLPREAEVEFLKRCRDEHIALAKRGEFVRISLHAFCNESEIEKVLELLS
jgi:selenocysteine lyase/cysteine desulfurase